ncbi:MAG TPA: C4-type zinc ribbon domain-containing protein [Longimicrobium sp.]|nr:C4-type zinc ribbon domain-containing protein [Longimicrobium sp.]
MELQDLKTQRRELAQGSADRLVQENVFGLSVDEALTTIDEKMAEMELTLPTNVRNRYQRMSAKHPRVVVPVLRGTCYGCFVQVPTALASDADRNEEIRACQSCGRFLYLID